MSRPIPYVLDKPNARRTSCHTSLVGEPPFHGWRALELFQQVLLQHPNYFSHRWLQNVFPSLLVERCKFFSAYVWGVEMRNVDVVLEAGDHKKPAHDSSDQAINLCEVLNADNTG